MSQPIVEQYLSGLLHKLNSAAKLLPSNSQGILYALSIFILQLHMVYRRTFILYYNAEKD